MARTHWSEACDTQLRRMRAEGTGWPEIGAALGVSADVARERARRIGARRLLVAEMVDDPEALDPDLLDLERDALPAGHWLAWRLLTADTLLANHPWPGYAA